jgi:hypothetical protein
MHFMNSTSQFADVVATEGDRGEVESLSPSFHFGDTLRVRCASTGADTRRLRLGVHAAGRGVV